MLRPYIDHGRAHAWAWEKRGRGRPGLSAPCRIRGGEQDLPGAALSAAEAAARPCPWRGLARGQFTDKAEPRVHSRLFGAGPWRRCDRRV